MSEDRRIIIDDGHCKRYLPPMPFSVCCTSGKDLRYLAEALLRAAQGLGDDGGGWTDVIDRGHWAQANTAPRDWSA